MKQAFKKAFIVNLPVMIAFLFLGIAYGMLMESNGYNAIWSFFISLFTFAGAAQYAMVSLLITQVHPASVFILILILNARHIFYGISMLQDYSSLGKTKWYLMFGLCDETFSLVSTITPPPDIDKKTFYFAVTILNHFYWVLGSVLGGILGNVLSFEIKGLEFILTALFVSVFVSQFKKAKSKIPALIGLIGPALMLIVFQENFIIPAMGFIIISLLLVQKTSLKEVS